MYLQEEKYVLRWLSQYGVLTQEQIYRLLKDKSRSSAEKIVANLKRSGMVSNISGGYYLSLDPLARPDDRIIDAMWVMIQFYENVDAMAHFPANYPSQLFFLKEQTGYEIIVLRDDEKHLARLIEPHEETKYIIVVPNASIMDEMIVPDIPHIFATLDYSGQKEPKVTFYTNKNKGENDGK